MNGYVFIYLFTVLVKCGCYKSAEVPDKDSKATIIEKDGTTYTTNLASCTLTSNINSWSVNKFQKGEKGLAGLKGDTGLQGPKGEKGNPGIQSSSDVDGEPGAPGENGKPGEKGEQGSIGLSGMPGHDGTCTQVCRQPFREPNPGTRSEGEPDGIGTKFKPADGLCNMKHSEDNVTLNGTIWVNPGNSFQVRCDMDSHMTCLLTNPKKEYNGEGAFYGVHPNESFWLSENNYNWNTLYGIPLHHIAWLQERATQVKQTIRYHCMNSYVNDQLETAIILYGWSDFSIGPYPTPNSPMTYSVLPKSHKCKPDAPKTEWRYSDIVITSKFSKRLPIVDARINDIRSGEVQKMFLELVELCFG